MSVLDDALLVVHCQLVGLSVHFRPPTKVSSLAVLYKSRKWNVVAGLSGLPKASNTAPPAPALVERSQSPTLAPGVLARRLPSIAKPPGGEIIGAMPAGGAAACAGKPSTSSERKTEPTDTVADCIRPRRA